jgi:hypothetical protein
VKIGNKGFFNPRIIKTIAFTLISLSIIGCIVLCIMAIWDYADRDTLWRMIATLGVIALGSGVFAFVNGMFGE